MDYIMPTGTKILPLRFNIPVTAEHAFESIVPLRSFLFSIGRCVLDWCGTLNWMKKQNN